MKLLASAALAALALSAAPARAEGPDLSAAPTFERLQLARTVADAGSPGDTMMARTVFGLPRNVGTVDRILRGAVAATLLGIGAYRLGNDSPNDTLSYTLMAVSAVPAATGATGYCPLYQALGFDTNF